jgi:hypothetical protein
MRLAPLPAEDRLTLELHEGQDDAPVFVYRPLNPRELARWTARLYAMYDAAAARAAAQAPPAAEGAEPPAPRRTAEDALQETMFYVELFEDRLVRVENLQVGDAAFDPADPAHRDALPLGWQVNAGAQILNRAQLSEDEQGKSSSPSASG